MFMVIAFEKYNENDHIRDYESFLEYRKYSY